MRIRMEGEWRMNRRLGVVIVLMSMIAIEGLTAQSRDRRAPRGSITGRVVDSELQVPLEYANIVLYDRTSQIQVTGTTTDKGGDFQLTGVRSGVYTLEADFIGYYANTIDSIEIKPGQSNVDLGTIDLKRAVLVLDGVDVAGEKPAIEFRIDKKVINVSKQYAAVSGTAVDVLENVPSVTVDIEGNVSLRGSSSFRVLIDGRPTVLEANEALQQIPASTIENIEIITNPSAKYDPDGVSGIINIITKERSLRGESGIANLNAGLDDNYGGDLLLNYKRGRFDAFFRADYNRRVYPGESRVESQTFARDTTSFIHSSGDSRWGRRMYGLRAGINLHLSANDIWSIASRYGRMAMENSSERDFDEWSDPGDTHNLYISESVWERGGSFYSANMDYRHTFEGQGHEISGQVIFSRRDGDEESTNELLDMNGAITSGQRSTEEGPSTRVRSKLDYSVPLRENDRFEIGYQSRFGRSEDITRMYDYDPVTGEYEFRPEYSHTIEYSRDIHSLYAIYSGELGHLGCQGGMRGEYTYRLIELMGENEDFSIDRWDLFPTVHVSYQHPTGHQIMASYTRRIERPRGWHLEPFETWSDAYNVRRGNPALKPEYIDSYELGYQRVVGRSLFSVEPYYRVTHNTVERVRTVYDANVILHTTENVGSDYTFGAELMMNLEQFKSWNLNLMGNLYDHRIEGELYDTPFSRESFSWSVRANNTLRFGNSTRLQINSIYNSPTVSSQGRREGFFTMNAAVKRDFLDRVLSATLQIRDILNTAKYEYTSEGADFYSHSESSRSSPVVMLTITYNLNNYRPERQRDEGREELEGEEDF